MMETLYQIAVHFWAFVGLILTAWITGVCIGKANAMPPEPEETILAAETIVTAHPNVIRMVRP